MLGAYILLLITSYKEFRPRFQVLNIAVLLFFVSLFLSTFFGVDWYSSMWDSHERMLGLFTLSHYIVFYFILSSVFKEKEDWRTFSWGFLICGLIVMLVGVAQKISPQLLLNNNSPRVIGTLGNAIYVAGLGLFMSYLGYIVGLQETISWKKKTAFAIGLMGLLGIFLSGTRGTLLAFFISLGLMLVLYFIFLKEHRKIRITIGAIIASGIILLGTLYAFRTTSFVSNIPALGRLLNTAISADTADTRIMAWSIAYESWKDHPVFGWGPNNYYYAFNQYYKPQFLLHGASETWFDNAHNVVMNTLATQGMFGLISYVFLFAAGIFVLVRGYRRGTVNIHIMVAGVAFLLGHFIHNIFVFENPTSYVYFYFFLAFICMITREQSEEIKEKTSLKKVSLPVIAIVSVLTFVFVFKTDINTGRANATVLKSIQYLYNGDINSGIDFYNKALTFGSPHIGDIRADFLRSSTQMVDQMYRSKQRSPDLDKLFRLGFAEGKKNLEFRSRDIRNNLMLAQASLIGDRLFAGEPSLVPEAEQYVKDVITLSPKRQQAYYILATLEQSQGKTQEAIDHLKYTITLEPKVSEGYIRLGILYVQTGRLAEAKNLLEDAKKSAVEFSPEQLRIISQIESIPMMTETVTTTVTSSRKK